MIDITLYLCTLRLRSHLADKLCRQSGSFSRMVMSSQEIIGHLIFVLSVNMYTFGDAVSGKSLIYNGTRTGPRALP